MDLERGYVIGRPNEPFEHIYFPEHLVTSVVANTPDGRRIEIGIFGREGMSGTSLLLGVDRSPHETFVQVPGLAMRIEVDEFSRLIQQSATLHQLLLRYVQAFNVQVAHTALSHGAYPICARLARWLLMCHDRLDGNELHLVHEFLALMLGVRRSGVTEQIHVLEGLHAIKATRGRITILDRSKLLEAAGDCYGIPEAEYERLIGPFKAF
jgi:CRP-like cAMP-binding protein